MANLFIHDIRWRPFSSAPVNTNGNEEVVKHHYQKGAPDRNNFGIQVGCDPAMRPMQFGKLKLLSPEEPVYALLIAAPRACTAGDDEEKGRFKRLLCNCKYTFLPMTDLSSIRRKAINIREELRTALGLVATRVVSF